MRYSDACHRPVNTTVVPAVSIKVVIDLFTYSLDITILCTVTLFFSDVDRTLAGLMSSDRSEVRRGSSEHLETT